MDIKNIGIGKIVGLVVAGVVLLSLLVLSGSIFENLNADRIMVIQSPISGKLTWSTAPGWKWQGFGRVTKYWKLDTYEFKIPVRFNDGGHGTIEGSINYELPFDVEHLNLLHTRYGSQEAIQKQLIETVANKCVYMTGPLMSSKESYAEKRTSLIRYIEDQIANGVYKTTQRDIKTKDPITGQEKTVTIVEIVMEDGKECRQEEAILSQYAIKTSNFAVVSLPYDEAVEGQIKQQQQLNMQVQTAMAAAKTAEQQAITVVKQGEANAATAKWEQEVVKAKEVTFAQQKLEVARLDKQAAEQVKLKLILEGEGEAEKRRLIMGADGALTQKLDAYKYAIDRMASAIEKQKWVPEIQMGNAGTQASTGAQQMIDMLMIKVAKDLSLDMKMKGNQ
ncbi:MAG: SPFH domain-containing protein [Candidatus Omnitrophica bacterium]|nr:SPFH domain-containing protein [Candidatus Omnitrophota bacterium]